MSHLLNLCLCVLISCVHSCTSQDSKGKQPMASQPPFTITLAQDTDGSILATLKNVSDRPQVYLHHLDHQPSELIVTNDHGDTLKPFDTRTIKKYDPTVYRAMYSTLQPREEVVLDRESFSTEDGRVFSLRWMPFRFDTLLPGRYSLLVRLECSENSWEDSETHEVGLMEDIWAGTLVSNPLKVTIPPGK